MCVCVCVRACLRVCVCVCVRSCVGGPRLTNTHVSQDSRCKWDLAETERVPGWGQGVLPVAGRSLQLMVTARERESNTHTPA